MSEPVSSEPPDAEAARACTLALVKILCRHMSELQLASALEEFDLILEQNPHWPAYVSPLDTRSFRSDPEGPSGPPPGQRERP